MRRSFLATLFGVASGATALLCAEVASAADIVAVVRADETRVIVGDVVEVAFELSRTTPGRLPTPELPDSIAQAFKVGPCSTGTSRSSSLFNGLGRSQTTRRVTCPLEAKVPGKHSITFTAREGAQKVVSNAIMVEVLAAGAPRGPLEDPTVEAPTDAREDVFLWVSTDKRRAYVGEQVTFRLDVYEARRFLDASLRVSPTFEGFSAEELPLPEVYTTTVDERPFRVRPGMRRALFPQRAGRLMIGAAELVISRRKRRVSDTLAIEVLPLPAEGRPAGFPANNVGHYQITAGVDREEVQPGEPLTLTYTISGRGNIDLVDPGPWAQLPSVRRYDPKVTTNRAGGNTVGGERSYAFLLIPERPGKLEIPSHTLPFFDPVAESYQVAHSEPLEVFVGGDPHAVAPDTDPAEPAGGQAGRSINEPLAPVLAVESVPRRSPRSRWLTQRRWGLGMGAVPLVVLFGLGGGWLWRRVGPDDAARAKARARARRRARIEAVQATVRSGDGFYAALASLLQGVALERAGVGGVGLPRPELMRLLEGHAVSLEDRRRLESLLDRCDAARFGAQDGSEDERHALLDEALAAVRGLVKEPVK